MNRIIQQFSKELLVFRRYIGVVVMLMLYAMTAYSQGTVKGTITDKSDNTPLIAANVVLKGTTFGTVTNTNGEFILPLKEGSHTLVISYVGYEPIEETLTIEDNQVVEVNAELAATSIMGEEVVVTVQARGQIAAVNQQIRSNQIINVVSAEKIRELPDENAAQAISRLPGIHLDGSKVVIRGVEPKMNKIMVNGIELPSTESENRATDLDMISANMLSGIEVFKTLTPDMEANAVGGVVNLRLREAQKGLHFSLTGQGTYNTQEEYIGKGLIWGDISNRFLDDRLGVLANFNFENAQSGTDRYEKGFSKDPGNSDPDQTYGNPFVYTELNVYDDLRQTQRIGGSLVLDYDLPKGQIIYSGMYTKTSSEKTEHRENMRFWDEYHFIGLEREKYNRILLNNSIKYEQQVGIVSIDATVGNVYMNHEDEFSYNFRFSGEVPFFVDDSVNYHNLRTASTFQVYDWRIPEKVDLTFQSHNCEFDPETYKENQWLADLNMKVPLRITNNINIDLKFGGKYKKKHRERYVTGLEYQQNVREPVNISVAPWLQSIGHETYTADLPFKLFRDYDYQPNGDFMNNEGARIDYAIDVDLADEMWLNQVDTDPATSLLYPDEIELTQDYWGWESYSAGFLMTEVNLGEKLVLIPGLRYERVHNEYSAYKVNITSMRFWATDTLTRPATHENWLPHIHLRYRITDWWDFRFSYNNTLTRPDYNHAIPSVSWHTSQSYGNAGNPYIKPATSENFDANFSFFSRKLGLITTGVFYKTLKDVFYMQETLLKNIPDTSIKAEFPLETYASIGNNKTEFYINSPYDGKLKGFEVEWQSNFTWLPQPCNGLVLSANYTRVWSEMEYILHRELKITPPGEYIPLPVEADTTYINRLLHQADDIANASVGYDYKGFSARLSFRYQGNVASRVAPKPEENTLTDEVYRFDLALKQNIPLKFGEVEVFLNGINLTNVPDGRHINYANGTQTTYRRYTGRQFQFGLRFKY